MKFGNFEFVWPKKLTQFQLARLKLTGWYLLIIMVICIAFSLAIYNLEFSDLEHRIIHINPLPDRIGDTSLFFPQNFNGQQIIDDSLNRLKLNLFYINLVILAISAVAGYFLAGRNLKPIMESMEEQSRFIADASHEMRTPLTALKTSTEVALRGKDLTLAETKELLNLNLSKINDMQTLSESLLKLAHDGSLPNSEKGLIKLDQLVEGMISKFSPEIKKKNITVEAKVGDLSIWGDEKSLGELISTLLDNAIKYSPNDSLIKILARTSDHHVEIQVQDQGVGINPDDLPHVFERFYRADKSRSSEIPGYGLGLSIAQKIVEDHDGEILVESKVGQGTRFLVRLPKNRA